MYSDIGDDELADLAAHAVTTPLTANRPAASPLRPLRAASPAAAAFHDDLEADLDDYLGFQAYEDDFEQFEPVSNAPPSQNRGGSGALGANNNARGALGSSGGGLDDAAAAAAADALDSRRRSNAAAGPSDGPFAAAVAPLRKYLAPMRYAADVPGASITVTSESGQRVYCKVDAPGEEVRRLCSCRE